MLNSNSLLRAFRGVYSGKSYIARARCIAITACVYAIWTGRNRAIFEGEKLSVVDIVHKIKIVVHRCIPSSSDMGRIMLL